MSKAHRPTIAWKFAKSALLAAGLLRASCRPVLFGAPAAASVPPQVNIAAPVSASAVAIDPTGEHLAAVNPDSGTISLIDGLSQGAPSAGREVPVGADPRPLSFTADGTVLLVAAYGSGTVAFVAVATGHVPAQGEVGSRPDRVVAGTPHAFVSPAGRPEHRTP